VASTEESMAHNQTVFRAGNEAVSRNLQERGDFLPLMCECADVECMQELRVTRGEYEAVRAHPRRFLVVSGHETSDAESIRVVERAERFSVLEKTGASGRIAEHLDPRSQSDADTAA
jgi:hypothetical protein